MSYNLSEEDKKLLNSFKQKRVGDKPYEDGYFLNKPDDFVYFELYDEAENLIQFKNLKGLGNFSTNTNYELEFYPASEIRNLGFTGGTFNVKYNFFRKLAGEDRAVLVRTKEGFEGDIVPNDAQIHITENGKVFFSDEESYLANPTGVEQLAIEDLKYQIDAISPSRTEVRLKAKNIEGSYIDDFIKVQESIRVRNVDGTINFVNNDSGTKQITISGTDFQFTDKMVNGNLIIPDVYTVEEIVVPKKTNVNIIQNPSGEILQTDNFGAPIKPTAPWDSTLHNDAVRVQDWSTGYNGFTGEGVHKGTANFGYHAKWVKGEGKTGGNCMKFPDTNDIFEEQFRNSFIPNSVRAEYDGNTKRWLGIDQRMQPLSSYGVLTEDEINVSLDVKTTVASKGVVVAAKFKNGLKTEEQPTEPPMGFVDPTQPPPTETKPDEPINFVPNTESGASSIESKPSGTISAIKEQLAFIAGKINPDYNDVLFDAAVGDTLDAFFPGVPGVWIISEIDYDKDLVTWAPNVQPNLQSDDVKGTKQGKLSPAGQWMWNGVGDWDTVAPTPLPIVAGTVNSIKYSNAVNGFIYTSEDALYPYMRRETVREENDGWQTGTTGPKRNYREVLLFKDDLVWKSKYKADDLDDLRVESIESTMPGIFRDTVIDGITLYEDVFMGMPELDKQPGFIQSVTRMRTYESLGPGDEQAGDTNNSGNVNEPLQRAFIVFYNDGRGLETSNKYFLTKANDYNSSGTPIGNNIVTGESLDGIQTLKSLNADFNTKVLENDNKFEVAVRREGSHASRYYAYYFFVGNKVYRLVDNFGNLGTSINSTGTAFITTFDNDYPKNINDVDVNDKPLLSRNTTPDVIFDGVGSSKISSYFNGIVEDSFFNDEGDSRPTEQRLEGCGILGDKGVNLPKGNRNPAASPYEDGDIELNIYDDETGVVQYPEGIGDTLMIGSLSPEGLYRWDGSQWVTLQNGPPSFTQRAVYYSAKPTRAGEWQRFDLKIAIPEDWLIEKDWIFRVYGHNGGAASGVTWADNFYMDFTLKSESVTQPVKKPFEAKIVSVANTNQVQVDKSYNDISFALGIEDTDLDTDISVVDGNISGYETIPPIAYESFQVSYLTLNPKDLRTYLKFENDLFLTTNFKQDKINVDWPHSVVYKLYEPLPNEYRTLDECIIVKQMADPYEDTIKIVDFVPEETPSLVLKSPDMQNVQSPIKKRSTSYKTESDILTSDKTISNNLRNSFLSQSFESVEVNTEYSQYKNFVNFSSTEKRVRNFKLKLEQIEDHKISSASYIGVSGSLKERNLYHYKIEDIKNNFDGFEKYMYFESSSYVSSSIGVFYDNSWPKTSGDGTVGNEYVLAHTTSSQASTWFTNAMESASLYDDDNLSKLSSILPEYLVHDEDNDTYLRFVDMIGQHFDHIWEYINALSDITDRRDKLDEGISKDLLYSVAKSLGWNLDDAKDLVSLPRYALGKEVTGSAYSDYSAKSERDISREIWSRIINNMPFFLKNKGTIRALKGLINVYGIPSTILRVKEYGGPNLPDDETPQFEIRRKFTKALDFRGGQYVKVAWADDPSTSRKPDTVEFRFRAATGSNQILVEKKDGNNQHWFIRLKDNGSTDNYGFVSFMLSGSAVGQDIGQYKEISSSALPIYDGDFYSVMVGRTTGSSDVNVSQSYQLNVGKYDSSRSKIHLYSTSTMDVTQAASSSFSNAWTGSGDIYIGGAAALADVGAKFSGSMMEYRHWTEVLNTGSFKNHVANPKAYDGNTVSSSYNNLVLRYSFDDNKSLASDTEGIRDVSSNQTTTLSGSHNGFTGNFFRNVVDEQKTHIPNIGGLRRVTNKVRIEDNFIRPNDNLQVDKRATDSAFDTSPLDSNRVGVFFAPTDVINNDIINSVGDLNFDNYLGDPRDRTELSYRGLNYVANNYWKKYTSPNNFWDYMRVIKYYDQSLFPQLKKMIPARAKSHVGLLIEPNIFERPKVVISKTIDIENRFYTASINMATEGEENELNKKYSNHTRTFFITSSYNGGLNITNYDAYTGTIGMSAYSKTGSLSSISASGEFLLKEASGSEFNDRSIERSIWQRLNTNDKYYSDVTMSFGDDTIDGVKEVRQPVISGSIVYGKNQQLNSFYTTSLSAYNKTPHSSSLFNSDLDNKADQSTALFDLYYAGVKNTGKTAIGNNPIEVVISAPTKLVTVEGGDSTLDTGDGVVPKFKDLDTNLAQPVSEFTSGVSTPPKVFTPKDKEIIENFPKEATDTIQTLQEAGHPKLEIDKFIEDKVKEIKAEGAQNTNKNKSASTGDVSPKTSTKGSK